MSTAIIIMWRVDTPIIASQFSFHHGEYAWQSKQKLCIVTSGGILIYSCYQKWAQYTIPFHNLLINNTAQKTNSQHSKHLYFRDIQNKNYNESQYIYERQWVSQ